MAATLDTDAILNDATEKLEKRFSEIQSELDAIEATKAPLKDEQATLAEAIHRLVGSYPSGYAAVQAMRTRRVASSRAAKASPEERAAAVIEAVSAAGAEGANGTQVAEAIGVSAATATKTIDALLESGQLKTNGKVKRARRLLVA